MVIWVILQLVITAFGYGQDDSSAAKQPVVKDTTIQNVVPAEETKVKKVVVGDSTTLKQKRKRDTISASRVVNSAIPPASIESDAIKKSNQVGSSHNSDSLASLTAYGYPILPFITGHPYYGVTGPVSYMPSRWFEPQSKDGLFYVFCGTLFFLGILKLGFPKYFHDIFNVFWRSAFRQKQIRDQIQQAGMTTLLFNTFFVFSAALFSYLAITHSAHHSLKPWLLFAICFFSIAIIYIGKYFILKITGWMFGQQDLADSYIFIVFLLNKILAILLIPLMLALAFGDGVLQKVAFTVSIALLLGLLIYRFVLSFAGFRNEFRISLYHLFLYVCGFEVIPVLVIYKLLLQLFVRNS